MRAYIADIQQQRWSYSKLSIQSPLLAIRVMVLRPVHLIQDVVDTREVDTVPRWKRKHTASHRTSQAMNRWRP